MPEKYHEDAHHPSNWCEICGLYYCWHPESGSDKSNRDWRAHNHEFKPGKTLDEKIDNLENFEED
jgi:hypothetical protein